VIEGSKHKLTARSFFPGRWCRHRRQCWGHVVPAGALGVAEGVAVHGGLQTIQHNSLNG